MKKFHEYKNLIAGLILATVIGGKTALAAIVELPAPIDGPSSYAPPPIPLLDQIVVDAQFIIMVLITLMISYLFGIGCVYFFQQKDTEKRKLLRKRSIILIVVILASIITYFVFVFISAFYGIYPKYK